MSENSLERKFEKRYRGIMQFVSDYQDFREMPVGACIWMSDRREDFFGFFEESSLEKDLGCQKVFLQYESLVGLSKKTIVGEYYLPLSGKIDFEYMDKNLHKIYGVDSE